MNRISHNSVKLCLSIDHLIFSCNTLPLRKISLTHPVEGGTEKLLDLPARSRFGEGRAETFCKTIQMAPKVLQHYVHLSHFNTINHKKPRSKTFEVPALAGCPKIQSHFTSMH
jgi:hypothetical protein